MGTEKCSSIRAVLSWVGFAEKELYNSVEICITLVSIAIKASKETRAWTQWKEPPADPERVHFDRWKQGIRRLPRIAGDRDKFVFSRMAKS